MPDSWSPFWSGSAAAGTEELVEEVGTDDVDEEGTVLAVVVDEPATEVVVAATVVELDPTVVLLDPRVVLLETVVLLDTVVDVGARVVVVEAVTEPVGRFSGVTSEITWATVCCTGPGRFPVAPAAVTPAAVTVTAAARTSLAEAPATPTLANKAVAKVLSPIRGRLQFSSRDA